MRRAFVTLRQPNFSTFDLISRELEKEFQQHFEDDSLTYIETENAFLTTVDLPGVKFTDIDIELEDNHLSIAVDRINPFDKTGKSNKKLRHDFKLPKNIDKEKINAQYENGVLSLTIPKAEEFKTSKKILVTTGEKPTVWANLLSFGKNDKE
jgi:HSP20 family protein